MNAARSGRFGRSTWPLLVDRQVVASNNWAYWHAPKLLLLKQSSNRYVIKKIVGVDLACSDEVGLGVSANVFRLEKLNIENTVYLNAKSQTQWLFLTKKFLEKNYPELHATALLGKSIGADESTILTLWEESKKGVAKPKADTKDLLSFNPLPA